MLASVKDILTEAKNKGYAVGAFNAFNMESAQGIVRAALKKHTPVIVQVTEKTLDYVGDGLIYEIVKAIIEKESAHIPIGFHLDHGANMDSVMRAVETGMNSVMLDAAQMSFRDNTTMLKRAVEYCHPKKVCVQGELGIVPHLGEYENDPDWEKLMTDPLEAKWFVEETEIDSLAVAVGNAHGFFREKAEPDWARLEEINKLIPNTPLVMHGGSDWVNHKVKEAVKRGVVCFNVATDLQVAFNTAICKLTSDRCNYTDPRQLMGDARSAIQKEVEKKIDLFRNP